MLQVWSLLYFWLALTLWVKVDDQVRCLPVPASQISGVAAFYGCKLETLWFETAGGTKQAIWRSLWTLFFIIFLRFIYQASNHKIIDISSVLENTYFQLCFLSSSLGFKIVLLMLISVKCCAGVVVFLSNHKLFLGNIIRTPLREQLSHANLSVVQCAGVKYRGVVVILLLTGFWEENMLLGWKGLFLLHVDARWHLKACLYIYNHILSIRAATNDYFHYRLICRSFSRFID